MRTCDAYAATEDFPATFVHFCEPVSSKSLFTNVCLRILGRLSACLGREEAQLLNKGMKLMLFRAVQDSHGCLKFLSMTPECRFHNALSFRRELQYLHASVARSGLSDDQAFSLQAVDCRGHRAAGQQHLGLNLGNRQRTLVQ